MKILKEIIINLTVFLLAATCTVTYSRFIKNVEKNGTINGKQITASDLGYSNENSSNNVSTVQAALDELYSLAD